MVRYDEVHRIRGEGHPAAGRGPPAHGLDVSFPVGMPAAGESAFRAGHRYWGISPPESNGPQLPGQPGILAPKRPSPAHPACQYLHSPTGAPREPRRSLPVVPSLANEGTTGRLRRGSRGAPVGLWRYWHAGWAGEGRFGAKIPGCPGNCGPFDSGGEMPQ